LFAKVIGLFKKSPVRLVNFPENARQSYRTFAKMSGKVREHSGKISVSQLNILKKIGSLV
jgi:hypothetical protein